MDLIEFTNRKGQSLQILMFALVIIGVGTGLLAFSNLKAAPVIFEDAMEDAPLISEAQTRTSDTTNYYIPLSAHYSVTQAAYDRGQDIVQLNSSSDIDNHHDNELDRIDDLSNSYYADYPQILSYSRCNVEISDKKINFGKDIAKINITQNDTIDEFVQTTCGIDGSIVRTSSKKDYVQKNASNIRFHQIMTMTLEGLDSVREEAQTKEDNNNYYGYENEDGPHCSTSSSSARSSAETSAENNAIEELKETREEIVQAAYDVFPISTGSTGGLFDQILNLFTRTINYILPWDSSEFDYEFSEENYSGQISKQSSGASRSSSCPCQSKCSCDDPPCGCCLYEYDGDATYYWELEEITVQSDIIDSEYEIPVDTGWENLDFTRRYYHNFPPGPE